MKTLATSPLLLLALACGCAGPSKKATSARLPEVTIALAETVVNQGIEISPKALKQFHDRVQTQISKEFGYRCIDAPGLSLAAGDGTGTGAVPGSDQRAALMAQGADYLLVPVIVQARDLGVGGSLAVDGTLYRCDGGTAVWQASGKAQGIDWTPPTPGIASSLLDIGLTALGDPNAFARHAGMALLQTFPAHLALEKAEAEGLAIPYLDRKGKAITPLGGPRLELLEDVHVMANSQGTKFVVPAQTLVPYQADSRGTYYAAHLMYVFGVYGNSVNDRVEELGGLFVPGDGQGVQVWCQRLSIRRKAPEGIRFRMSTE